MQYFTNPIKRARAILPACLVLSATVILAFLPILPASLLVTSSGTLLYEQTVKADTCEVMFRHSVNKGLIREIYRIDSKNCRIALVQSYNQSFGAGMLDTVEDTAPFHFRSDGGQYYIMDFPAIWQEQINYIGGNIAGHVFSYQDDVIHIGEERPKQPFRISVKKRSIVDKVLNRT